MPNSLTEFLLDHFNSPLILFSDQDKLMQITPEMASIIGEAPETLEHFLDLLDDENRPEPLINSPSLKQALASVNLIEARVQIRSSEHGGRTGNLNVCRVQNDNRPCTLFIFKPQSAAIEGLNDETISEVVGLPGKYLLMDRIQQGIVASARAKKSLAIIIININRFRVINEGLGREAGKQLLTEIGKRLKQCVRNSDTVAHYQANQFAMLLQISHTDDGVIVAEKILRSLRQEFKIKGNNIHVSASIGISLCPVDSNQTEELLKLADSAMSQARKKDYPAYEFYTQEFNIRARNRIQFENDLHRALTNNEFRLYYQPKVSASDGTIVGMEGLIRWFAPDRGMVSPGEFIPVAEETGIINEIGSWVIFEGCRQNKEWIDKGLKPLKLSVNVSSQQLAASDFIDIISSALKQTAMPASLLELEITESMLISNVEDTIGKMETIRKLGCHLSIDDFGTGYSSLSYLTRFPISTLKIDRSFVKGLASSDTTEEVAKAIITLSKGLNLEVVAEGAESQQHVDFLQRHGCDSIQGFYFAPPVPADEFEKMLRKGKLDGQDVVS